MVESAGEAESAPGGPGEELELGVEEVLELKEELVLQGHKAGGLGDKGVSQLHQQLSLFVSGF